MIFKTKYSKLSDEELMSRSAKGDTRAFTALYDRYSGKMYSYFYKMLWQDKEKAQDFSQDLFSKIIQKPESYNSNKKFSPWIYSIAANMCKNEYRSYEVRQRANSEITHSSYNTSYNTENVDGMQFKNDLNTALDVLSPEQRIAFIMKHKQGFKIREIAEALSCSEGTIKSRLFYALKTLSKELEVYNPKSEL